MYDRINARKEAREVADPNPLAALEGLEPGGMIGSLPAVDDKNLYFGSADFHVYSLDKKSGALVWKFRTRGMITLGSVTQHKDLLYTGDLNGYIYALESKNGNLVWEFKTNDGILSVLWIHDNKLFVTSMDGHLYCLDNSDGRLLWKVYLGRPVMTSPSVVNGNIFVSSMVERNYWCISEEGRVLWKLAAEHWPVTAAFGTPDGKFIADSRTRKNVDCDDFAFMFATANNKLYLADPNGSLIWKKDVGAALCPGTIHDGGIYSCASNSKVYSFSIEDGSQNWSYSTGDTIVWNIPLIHNDILFTGSCDGNVYALDPKSGDLVWRFQTAGPVISPAIVSDDIAYIGSWDSHMYAFDVKNPGNPALIWKFATGMPPAPPRFIKWFEDFEKFREKYLGLQWKPETIKAGNDKSRSGYEGPAGIGDDAAFSTTPYEGFKAGEAYKEKKTAYTSKKGRYA